MLTIRNEQMRALQLDQSRRFKKSLAAHLARRFSGWPIVADPERLSALVDESVALAAGYGIVNRFDVRRFLECRAEYGTDFHRLPWAATILNEPTLSGSGKMERIDEYCLFALRS